MQIGQPFTTNLKPEANKAHLRTLYASGRIVVDRNVQGSGTFSLPRAGNYIV